MSRPILEMRGIAKHYGAVRANDGIDLDVRSGSIIGLLGENGSGKSTLMKILFGMTVPDEGVIVFKSRELSGHTPAAALAAGIGMVHQHFMLVEAMSVLENIMLGWPRAGRVLRTAEIARLIVAASAQYGLDLDPHSLVETLSLGARQRVEILKALLRGVDLLVLDEPTSNLSPPEVAKLLNVMRRLRAEQRSVIFISHKLGEVLEICDDIAVLRDGKVVGNTSAAQATRESLAAMMVGRPGTGWTTIAPRAGGAPGRPLLAVESLDLPGNVSEPGLRTVQCEIRAGEIVAIVGVDGNGQRELTDTIAGMRAPSAGRIYIDGKDMTRVGIRQRIEAGLSYIPSDRAATSLVPAMSIADNLMLRDYAAGQYSRGPWLRSRRTLADTARRLMRAYDVRADGPEVPVRQLSGGNQQKIVVAREVDRQPKVMVALQPTWGLDPAATRFVLDRMLALRAAGSAVLYVTAELEEGLAIGDRIGVMYRGRLSPLMSRDKATPERIGLLMATGEDTSDMTGRPA
jgi:simple sugar transport system ATP-binding protein